MESYAFHLMPYPDVESVAWPFAEDAWDPETGARYYEEYLDQLVRAAEVGFDGLGVNEHHYSVYGLQPSPNITAATLAGRTEDVDLAFFGNLPAIRENPIRLAEEVAMLDNISRGRVVSGFPRGIPSEYLAYNVPRANSRERFREAWDLIMEAWTAEAPFDWDGEYYQYEDVYIWPRPYQQPTPRLWMPAQSEPSLRFAAERQLPTGTALSFEDEMGETFEAYRTYAEEDYGWTPRDEHFTVLTWAYVADSKAQAREEAKAHLEYFNHVLFAGVHLGVAARMHGDDRYRPERHDEYVADMHPAGRDALEWDIDAAIERGEVLLGSPAEIVEQVESIYEAVGGFGRLVTHLHFGDMPHETAMRNVERFGDDVVPELHRIGDGP